jgi:hypothetical protein
LKFIKQVWPCGVLPCIAVLLVGLAIGCGDNLPVLEPSCAAPATDCEGTCRRLQSDPANCGACGSVCATDQVCGAGACVSTCPIGTTACNGSCVNLANDVTHCGECSTACSTEHGTPACAAGACAIAACDAGYFASGGACLVCSAACLDGQFQSAACSADADRACSTCATIAGCSSVSCTSNSNAVCNACNPGLFWSGTACEACSTGACAAGTYETAACTATADRMCGACTAIAGCATETCTTGTDQTCLACAAGGYLSGNACLQCSTAACPSGSIEIAACSATADRICGCTAIADCASETCTTATDQTCLACNSGDYLSGNACLQCSTAACPTGSIEIEACSATADRICGCTAIAGCASEICATATDQTCLACDSGSYLSGNACLQCSTTACPNGSIETVACSATADRVCGCTAIAGCASETCTTATDQTCLACNSGSYLSGGACAACTACRPGQFQETACGATTDATCAAVDCYALHAGSPGVGDGIYSVDPDGPGGASPFQAYCDMTSDGGGWTLLMKVDGSLPTFSYQAALWTSTNTYQPDEVAFDVVNETKSFGFATMPFNAMRVGMFDLTDGGTRWLDLPRVNGSLLELFTSGFQSVAVGRNAWKGLVASPSLQLNCNRDGFNVVSPDATNVRIGIVSNQENNCDSPDSRIGIGTEGNYCGQDQTHSAGNEARCGGDHGDRTNPMFGFVMVRNCPGGVCQCGALTSCDALCVDMQTDLAHCGSCASSCGQQNAVAACVSGGCQTTCNPGFTDCDANPANGCEANFANDNANCGACGAQCATGLTCTSGACVDLAVLQIDNPNGATVEYLPRSNGNRDAAAEGTCTGDCTVHPALGNTGMVRIRSAAGFASGCDIISGNGQCYVQLPAHVVMN